MRRDQLPSIAISTCNHVFESNVPAGVQPLLTHLHYESHRQSKVPVTGPFRDSLVTLIGGGYQLILANCEGNVKENYVQNLSHTAQNEVKVLIIGAGPAGLTAAAELAKLGLTCHIVEESDSVGGISRTEERNGWRFDIGGHRFFTKVARVEAFWNQVLSSDDFMNRPRMSRIYYKKKFFDYPLKASNALVNLGIVESVRCVLSYVWVRLVRPKDMRTFEGWTASRFGWRLYRIFFKTYTEKVWGVPATEIQADWAAQRIKNLSLMSAILGAVFPRRDKKKITSLIEEFQYPRLGPGMLWEACAQQIVANGSRLSMQTKFVQVQRQVDGGLKAVCRDHDGQKFEIPFTHLISSMPLGNLIESVQPPAPIRVLDAAKRLRFRDFLTVALVVPDEGVFPDNWIYVHDPSVKVGRIQNFRSWSPFMVKDGYTCLGLEYFVNVGDEIWTMPDEMLISFAKQELSTLNLVDCSRIAEGYVVRMPKAYPMYDSAYRESVTVIKTWLADVLPNVIPVGRNGMHRYNNQDHSMLTAMLAVENILGATHDIWAVNVEEDYHEEVGNHKA